MAAARRQREAARRLRPHRGGHRHHGDAAGRVSRRQHRHSVSRHARQDLPPRHRGRTSARARKARSASSGPSRHGRLPRRPRGDAPQRCGGMPMAASGCTPATSAAWMRTASSISPTRLKRMIKSSGFNVFPAQVEAVLYTHPQVLEACVVGVPDPAQVRASEGLRRAQGAGAAGRPTPKGSLIAHVPRATHQMVMPARDRVPSRAAEDAHRQDRLPSAGGRAHRTATISGSPISHGGDRVAAALQAHGVRFVFTLCGGHISPILTGAKARGLRVVDVRDEATAVFAADAVARLTGVPGVAAVTAGPGVTNTLTALKNAQLAQSPLVLLGGAAPTALQGRGALQDIDQGPLVAPHVKLVRRVRRVRDLAPAVEEAFAVARDGVPGTGLRRVSGRPALRRSDHSRLVRRGAGKGTSIPDRLLRFYLERHVARMFAGSGESAAAAGARGRGAGRARFAHRRGRRAPRPGPAAAPASSAARPSRSLPTRRASPPPSRGSGYRCISRVWRAACSGAITRCRCVISAGRRCGEADCVVLAGVPCDFRLDYGRHVRRSSTLIAANRSAKEARLNRRPDIAAIGDAGDFLERLAAVSGSAAARRERLDRRAPRPRLCARGRDRRTGESRGRAREPDRAAARCRSCGGRQRPLCRRRRRFRRHRLLHRAAARPARWLDPGVFGTLGVGAGFALGAALCRPDAEVWILYGDGACGWSLSRVRHLRAPRHPGDRRGRQRCLLDADRARAGENAS